MSSSAVRAAVWERLRSDTDIQGLGYAPEAVFPNYSGDSPTMERFIVLRWGPTTPGVGPAHTADLGLWVYNRQPDYDPISRVLLRARSVLALLVGTQVDGGAFMGIGWGGAGPDIFDDAWSAYGRAENYTVTASGN